MLQFDYKYTLSDQYNMINPKYVHIECRHNYAVIKNCLTMKNAHCARRYFDGYNTDCGVCLMCHLFPESLKLK